MLVLASQSPRRQEILTQAGFSFTVRPAGVEEERRVGEFPHEYVLRLAYDKAAAVGATPAEWILAADTVVVVDGVVLEKPRSVEDAAAMLRLLSGRDHFVLTGVCLRHDGQYTADVESTLVRFVALTELEIQAYAACGEPMDKAGAYAIQGLASKFVERIEGCYYNVVGLPIARVFRMLKEAGYVAGIGG